MNTTLPAVEALSVPTVDLFSESLADQLVRHAAAAAGISYKGLVTGLERDASLDAHANCLQPHELENHGQLPPDRVDHLKQCLFCKVLVDGATPRYEDAAVYAVHAAQIAKTKSRARHSPLLDFLTDSVKLLGSKAVIKISQALTSSKGKQKHLAALSSD